MEIIIGCLIANILTIAIILAVGRYFYNKYNGYATDLIDNIINFFSNLQDIIASIKSAVFSNEKKSEE